MGNLKISKEAIALVSHQDNYIKLSKDNREPV